MIFERGPRAFVKETTQMIRFTIVDGSPVNQLLSSASVHISERMAILSRLRCLVAGFLAEVCMLCFFLRFISCKIIVPLLFWELHLYLGDHSDTSMRFFCCI